MNLDYFIRKQELLISKISFDYIRIQYLKLLEEDERLIGFVGPRGVGKTTLLLQYLKKCTKKYLFLNGDDVELMNIKLVDIVDEFYSLGGRVLVVDEIHKYQNWSREIKNIYDSYPDIYIKISGSSMINILYEKYDLSRRIVLHNVDILSFKEYLELTKGISLKYLELEDILTNADDISKELVFKYEDIYSLFKQYLNHGAYPFYLEGVQNFEQKLFNATDKIIHEDIPSLNKIDYTHISIFSKLIFIVASSQKPFEVNIARLSREVGISEPTLYTYLNILQKTKIFNPIKKFSKKVSKKPQKLLFSNTNILYSYYNEFNIDVDIGTIRETFFSSCFKEIFYSDIGDFRVNDIFFEVGGKNKSFSQIKDIDNSYLVLDIDFTINNKKIPLWLFGFLRKK